MRTPHRRRAADRRRRPRAAALAAALLDLLQSRLDIKRRQIRPVRNHRLDHVDDGEDARERGDLITSQPLRIAAAVQALVMVEDGVGDLTREAGELQEVAAGPAVLLDDGELRRAQARGLAEDLSRHGDLADVVHGRGKAQQSDLVIGVAQASRDLHRELGDATLVPGGIGGRVSPWRWRAWPPCPPRPAPTG